MDKDEARVLAIAGSLDAQRYMTRASTGGVALDEAGVLLVAGGHPMPFLMNAVARTDPNVPAADVLARARDFFRPRDRGYSVLGLEGQDDDLIAAANADDFRAMGDAAPLMAVDEPPAVVDVPDGARIDPVKTEVDVEALVDVCADAYSVYGMPADVAAAVHTPRSMLLAPHIAAVVAQDDEGPVATATAVATMGTAYVQWVATRQRAFGRGLGAAVTQAVTIAGFALGARLATLGASPMGASVYRRIGWIDVGMSVTLVTFGPR
jgi:hypothetical protein